MEDCNPVKMEETEWRSRRKGEVFRYVFGNLKFKRKCLIIIQWFVWMLKHAFIRAAVQQWKLSPCCWVRFWSNYWIFLFQVFLLSIGTSYWYWSGNGIWVRPDSLYWIENPYKYGVPNPRCFIIFLSRMWQNDVSQKWLCLIAI